MLKKIIPKSEFNRNVLTLMTGSTLAQVIPIAISPILTRIYSPSDFGVFAIFLSISAILTIAASGRYELAIMLPKRKEDAFNLLVLSLIIVVLISLVSFLLIFTFNKQITGLLENQEISTWLYFIPLSVLFAGIYNSFNYWSNRKKQYKKLATSRVIQNGTTALTNLGMGISHFEVGGLVAGNITGRGLSAIYLSSITYLEDKSLFKNINKLRIIVLMKKYIDFPKLNLPHSVFNSFSSELPIFLITYFFQATITGYYSFANRVLLSPINVITRSYAQVFLQRMTQLHNHQKDEVDFFKKTVSSILLYSFPFFLILFLFVPDVFSFVFGSDWYITGIYSKILLPMLFLRFAGTIVSSVVIIYNEQKKAFFLELINSFLRGSALIIGGLLNNIIWGLVLFSLFSSLITGYRLFWYSQIVKRSSNDN